jgi:hypothetical protein
MVIIFEHNWKHVDKVVLLMEGPLGDVSINKNIDWIDIIFYDELDVLGMSCKPHKITCWLLERKSRWVFDPLWSIKLRPWNLDVF